jgi:hypothetical protein
VDVVVVGQVQLVADLDSDFELQGDSKVLSPKL